jgi:nucleoside-diphosphate-sugar epimerase
LITGITGMIGSTLAQHLLKQGWTVHGIVRSSGRTSARADLDPLVVLHEISDPAQLPQVLGEAEPTVVFHLASLIAAAHSTANITAMVEANLLLGAHLMEAMAATGARRLVNAGTYAQHYHMTGYRPATLYAATKQAFEDLMTYYRDAAGISTITLKPFNVYGRGEQSRRLVQILVEAAETGTSIDLTPGGQTLDLVHVDDVAEGFRLAALRLLATETVLDESFFLSGERMTLKELVALIGERTGKPVNANFGGNPYRDREIMMPVHPDPILPGWSIGRSIDRDVAS